MWGLGSASLNNFALYHFPFIFTNYIEHLVVKRVNLRGDEAGRSYKHFSIHFSFTEQNSMKTDIYDY